MGWMMAGTMLSRCGSSDEGGAPMSNIANLGPLQAPDENGLRLPEGFTSRVIARARTPVGNTMHLWHAFPDGGAVFTTADGGWVYVSNSEVPFERGGVGAIRFSESGEIVDAYSILTGTSTNCAGGAMP